jgi:hypothetical protein
VGILSGTTAVKRAKILNICFLGLFTPFMFSIIKGKNRGVFFFILNWMAIGVIGSTSSQSKAESAQSSATTSANTLIGFTLWIILLVAAFKIKVKVKSKGSGSSEVSVNEIDAVLEAKKSNSIFNRISLFADYFFSDYWAIKRLEKNLGYQEYLINQTIQTREAFTALTLTLHLSPSVAKSENELISVNDCILIEPRKGSRVTERTSSSSGRGYAGVRVGRVYVGGSGGSTSQSRSVAYPAPDVLKQVDSGRFILTTHRASFAGSMFTKSTEYKKMLDYNYDGNTILIAPRTGSKVWIAQFQSVEYAWVVRAILNGIIDSETQIFDDSKTKYGPKISEFIESGFRAKLFEINELIKDENSALNSVKAQIKILKNKHAREKD